MHLSLYSSHSMLTIYLSRLLHQWHIPTLLSACQKKKKKENPKTALLMGKGTQTGLLDRAFNLKLWVTPQQSHGYNFFKEEDLKYQEPLSCVLSTKSAEYFCWQFPTILSRRYDRICSIHNPFEPQIKRTLFA